MSVEVSYVLQLHLNLVAYNIGPWFKRMTSSEKDYFWHIYFNFAEKNVSFLKKKFKCLNKIILKKSEKI